MVAILGVVANIALGDTHYVSTNGLDIAPYTNWANASRSVHNAVNEAGKGDTVLVNEGTYYFTKTLKPINWMVIKSVKGARRTIFDGGYPASQFLLVSLDNGMTLDGFTLQNAMQGAQLYSFAYIQNCIIHHCNVGLVNYGANKGTGFAYNMTIAYNYSLGYRAFALILCPQSTSNFILYGNGKPYETILDSIINIRCWITNDPCFYSTNDFRLLPNSPAIDAGEDTSFWLAGSLTNIVNNRDADGNARLVNGYMDCGAYEYNPNVVVNFNSNPSINSTILISWNTIKGVSYSLEYTTNLMGNCWTNLNGTNLIGDGATLNEEVSISDASKYYRIKKL